MNASFWKKMDFKTEEKMKLKLLKRLGIVMILVVCAFAQVNAQSNDQSSLLWKISGNGLTEVSYLFGTIHIICADQFLMDDRIKNAFQSTDQLIMELDMSDPDLEQKMAAVSINPGMKNIQEEIEEEAEMLGIYPDLEGPGGSIKLQNVMQDKRGKIKIIDV